VSWSGGRASIVPVGLWIAVIFVVSLPWIGFATEPQWDRLYWIPFTDPQDKPLDLVTNIALFLPFGYGFARDIRSARRRLGRIALTAVVVSVAAETPQLFSTLRNPSATDVAYAVAGALAGGVVRLLREHRESRRT
jgi:glycopeptide antibiotics resistance protein